MHSTSYSARIDAEDRGPSDEDCKADPGLFKPVVDVRRCEGKAECVAVCPYHVFAVGRLSDATFDALPIFTKLKLWAHGRKTAYTPHADACRACGLCVTACPERAIQLVRVPASGKRG
jgi:4Fe-4S ferredoxin